MLQPLQNTKKILCITTLTNISTVGAVVGAGGKKLERLERWSVGAENMRWAGKKLFL